MQKMFKKLMSVVPALAFLLAAGSVAAPCHFFYRQPDVPEGLMKYEK